MAVAVLALAVPAAASAAPAQPNPFGQWGDKNRPKGEGDYMVQPGPAANQIRLVLPAETKLPMGRAFVLQRVSPHGWATAPGAQPRIAFELLGPASAHVAVKGGKPGASWFSGWAIYMDDMLIRR